MSVSLPADVRAPWSIPDDAHVETLTSGLINTTFRVEASGEAPFILQRLNTSIFRASVHEDMCGVGARLLERGVLVPTLRPTLGGKRWLEHGSDVWRAMNLVGHRTLVRLDEAAHARSAGQLIARFHGALADFDWTFHHVRPGAHDTPAHMQKLRDALADHPGHRLYDAVATLAEDILAGWDALSPKLPTQLPVRIVHGDLKISNIRFDGDEAVALIDLDTLAHGTLDVELGDALRSWCASASEDATEVGFRLDLFTAGMRGYAEGCTDWSPDPIERSTIALGIQRICTELAARFAADALNESYFGWDAKRFATSGDHNLVRAAGQLSLAQSVARVLPEAERVLATLWRS